MELEAPDALPDGALVPQRSSAEEPAPQFPEGAGLIGPGQILPAIRADAGGILDPAAEGAFGREEEVQHDIDELHDPSSSS